MLCCVPAMRSRSIESWQAPWLELFNMLAQGKNWTSSAWFEITDQCSGSLKGRNCGPCVCLSSLGTCTRDNLTGSLDPECIGLGQVPLLLYEPASLQLPGTIASSPCLHWTLDCMPRSSQQHLRPIPCPNNDMCYLIRTHYSATPCCQRSSRESS